MNWRRIEEYVRGWLPKAPSESDKRGGSGVTATTQTDPRLRLSGNIFSNLGIFLIIFVVFRFVIQIFIPTFFNPVFSRTFFNPIQLVFAAGFILLMTGMTLRAVDTNVEYLKSPTLTAGLTLLTISVFGIAFNTMLGFYAVNITLPKYGSSLAASVVFSFVGLGGLLLLAKERTALSGSASFPRKPYSILSAGVLMNLVVTPVQALLVFGSLLPPSSTGTVVPIAVAIVMSVVMMPLGTIFTIYGWAAIFSYSAKRRRSILLMALAVFVAMVIVSLVI
jgi:hypothetical protein